MEHCGNPFETKGRCQRYRRLFVSERPLRRGKSQKIISFNRSITIAHMISIPTQARLGTCRMAYSKPNHSSLLAAPPGSGHQNNISYLCGQGVDISTDCTLLGVGGQPLACRVSTILVGKSQISQPRLDPQSHTCTNVDKPSSQGSDAALNPYRLGCDRSAPR